MKFITVEQFREQPMKVQKVFLDWWECDYGDFDYFKSIGPILLFTEGQLRKFIEDKEGCLLDVKVENLHDNYNDYTVIGWEIKELDHGKEFGRILFEDCIEAEGLLRLYWKVACSVAKEGVNG